MGKTIQSYEVLETLGVGGMGVVVRAKHQLTGAIVAIKSLNPSLYHDFQVRERFIQEAKILSKLEHKNIVRVLDLMEYGDTLHMVMEYVEGRTLAKMIGRETGPIPYEKALPLFNQICEGVGYAHTKGVVHRDLKPSNIMVTPSGEVRITDFGIAKIEGGLHTKTGTKMGTLYYMSPEQIQGSSDIDERSDIYSLGITLYEMLAGRLPFENVGQTSEFQLMKQIVEGKLPDPREYYESIPEYLVELIKSMTKGETTRRIRSLSEVKKVLEKQGVGEVESGENTSKEQQTAETTKVPPVGPVTTEKQGIQYSDTNNNSTKVEVTKNKSRNRNIAIAGGVLVVFVIIFSLMNSSSSLSPAEYSYKNMVFVEGGAFQMGSNNGMSDEQPVHQVTLSDFYISKYEVTQKEWVEVMGNNPSSFKGDNLPVESVSWNDIQTFIQKLHQKTGGKYRLPTEAEWEYAARGGNKSQGYTYSGSNSIDEVAWYDGNSGSKTHAVGTKKSNELAIYDMSGNVWEWVQDWYGENYYSNSPGTNPTGPSSGSSRVLRGGSWYFNDNLCRVASRNYVNPVSRNDGGGFRLAQDR